MMADDGAGIAVLELLAEKKVPGGVDVIDAGTGGMSLLHVLADFDFVVIADAVDMGMRPGTVRSFSPDDVVSVKELRRISLHEGDVFEILIVARRLGQCPDNVVICAIQPKRVEPGIGLSPPVREGLRRLSSAISDAVALAL